MPYDGLVIATGAAPRRLPGQPDLPGVFLLRTLDDCLALRAAFRRRSLVALGDRLVDVAERYGEGFLRIPRVHEEVRYRHFHSIAAPLGQRRYGDAIDRRHRNPFLSALFGLFAGATAPRRFLSVQYTHTDATACHPEENLGRSGRLTPYPRGAREQYYHTSSG